MAQKFLIFIIEYSKEERELRKIKKTNSGILKRKVGQVEILECFQNTVTENYQKSRRNTREKFREVEYCNRKLRKNTGK